MITREKGLAECKCGKKIIVFKNRFPTLTPLWDEELNAHKWVPEKKHIRCECGRVMKFKPHPYPIAVRMGDKWVTNEETLKNFRSVK